jgi:hypothetical protein
MREVEKDGVLIDICPECKGVWLDRGELDKLLQGVREERTQYDEWIRRHEDDYERHHGYDRSYSNDKHRYPKKKKRSMFDLFEDLFD